jgi:hypothetical protein
LPEVVVAVTTTLMIIAAGRMPDKSTFVGSWGKLEREYWEQGEMIHVFVCKCSDRPDVHCRVYDELFQLRELWCIMVPNELNQVG